jgi:ribonuclease/clavin/mitogillin
LGRLFFNCFQADYGMLKEKQTGGNGVKGIHRIPVATPTLLPAQTTSVYIVEDTGKALIIDTGYDDENAVQDIINKVTELGLEKIEGIILTHYHRDHSLGTKHLIREYNCPLLCHPLEQAAVEALIAPLQVSKTIEDGEQLRVGNKTLTVLHTPGHTRGHISLWWEEEKILFSGDNIVGEGTTWIGPPDGNLVDYLHSLQRIRELAPKYIAPGHGEWIEQPLEKIDFVINRRKEREQQILKEVANAFLTAGQLRIRIYQETIPPSSYWAAEKTIISHLEKLIQEGQVQTVTSGDETIYKLKD